MGRILVPICLFVFGCGYLVTCIPVNKEVTTESPVEATTMEPEGNETNPQGRNLINLELHLLDFSKNKKSKAAAPPPPMQMPMPRPMMGYGMPPPPGYGSEFDMGYGGGGYGGGGYGGPPGYGGGGYGGGGYGGGNPYGYK